MTTAEYRNHSVERLHRYIWIVAIIWTLLLSILLGWYISDLRQVTHELAVSEARANFNKDQAFRHWASRHGGVYVPVSQTTPPNPYLSHVPNRDIETPTGKKLTLMNPAYMVRELNEQFTEMYGVQGHITSLRVFRPGNEPDSWESQALHDFESGVMEVMEYSAIDGKPYLRLMQPMHIKQHCLKCHEIQGYKVGDVRGGVSVSIPISGYLVRRDRAIFNGVLAMGGIWIMGIGGILLGGRRLLRSERERLRDERELQQMNSELRQYAEVTSHQLQEPLEGFISDARLVRQRCQAKADEELTALMGRTLSHAEQMEKTLVDLRAYASVSRSSATPPPTDSRIVVTHLLERMKQKIDEAGAEVSQGELPVVPMEELHLDALLEHLLDNALKYHAEGTPRITIACKEEPGHFLFTVEDNGPGISPVVQSRLSRLFDDDHKADISGEVVGLALCHKLVSLYGGEMGFDSDVDAGTTIHFTLPKIPGG